MNINFINELKVVLSASANLFGGYDALLGVLLLMMLADIVTGVIKAILGKSEKSSGGYLDSQVMWKSGLKKVTILIVILISSAINRIIEPSSKVIRNSAVLYYISVEALSSIENVGACGLPLPVGLKNVLEKIKKENK